MLQPLYIVSPNKVVSDFTLPAATQELVKLRACRINGGGFYTDMYTKHAAHAGESSTRLNLVAARAWCLPGSSSAPERQAANGPADHVQERLR